MIVDVQNDFLPGGALAVPGAGAIIPVINRCIDLFVRSSLPVIATRDWHPEDHCSFEGHGGRWPAHCVRGTPGAEFPRELKLPGHTLVISKAQEPGRDAYSGFEETGLAGLLREMGIRRIFACGLATDYCVRQTVLDALELGFSVVVLQDAVRAVEIEPGDGRKALSLMKSRGARIQESGFTHEGG